MKERTDMATKEQWDRLEDTRKAYMRGNSCGFTLQQAMADVLLSMRPTEGPEAASELPPYPEGCERFRMDAGHMRFIECTGNWFNVAKIDDRDLRHDCANAAIAWFLRKTLAGVPDGNDYDAARAWYKWREGR